MKRKFVHLLCFCFNLTGINVVEGKSESLNNYVKFIFILFLICCGVFSMIMYIYVNITEITKVVISIGYASGMFYLSVILLKSHRYRKKIGFLLKKMDDNTFTYSNEEDKQLKYEWILREENTDRIHFVILFCQWSGIILISIPPIIQLILGNMQTTFLYPGWMPWNVISVTSFMLTYFFQLLTTFSGVWSLYLIQCFIVFNLIEFSRQNKRLCTVLSNISKREEYHILKKNRSTNAEWDTYSDIVEKNLIQCIKHHQMLTKLFKIFQCWFSTVFSLELGCSSIPFMLLLYNLFFQVDSMALLVSLIGATLLVVYTIFTRCLVGELFSAMNERIVTTIFEEVNWYDQNLKCKKLILIFHSQVRRSMDFYGLFIIKASFSTFASLLRTTYSCINILRIFIRK